MPRQTCEPSWSSLESQGAVGDSPPANRLVALNRGRPGGQSPLAEDAANRISDPGRQTWRSRGWQPWATTSSGHVGCSRRAISASPHPNPTPSALALARISVQLPLGESRRAAGLGDRKLGGDLRPPPAGRAARRADPTFKWSAELEAGMHRAIVELEEPWLQALASRRIAPHLLHYEAELEENKVDTSSLILGAITADLLRELALPSDFSGLWAEFRDRCSAEGRRAETAVPPFWTAPFAGRRRRARPALLTR